MHQSLSIMALSAVWQKMLPFVICSINTGPERLHLQSCIACLQSKGALSHGRCHKRPRMSCIRAYSAQLMQPMTAMQTQKMPLLLSIAACSEDSAHCLQHSRSCCISQQPCSGGGCFAAQMHRSQSVMMWRACAQGLICMGTLTRTSREKPGLV